MNTMLDIAGSFILFGTFLIAVMTVNSNITSMLFQTNLELISQQNIVALAELFDHDLLKVGYGKTSPKLKPGATDSVRITWYSDFDNDGAVDSISYFLGDVSELADTPNPNDRILYRQINNDNPVSMGVGVVYFNLTYFDSVMAEIPYSELSDVAGVNRVRAIRVRVQVESPYAVDERYGGAFWERTYIPRNL